MVTKKSVLVSSVLAALLLAGGLFLLNDKTSTADDTTHTTVFYIGNKDYGLGGGAEQALIARIDSTDTADTRARVQISAMLPGTTSYTKMVGTTAYRSSQDGLFAEATQPVYGYASGTVVQAVFTTFDNNGVSAFTYTRSLTIP